MTRRRFHTVNVFSQGRLDGNPVAVIVDGDGMTTEEMQQFTVTGYTQPALASWGDGPHDPAPGEAVTVGDFAVHSLTLVPPPEPTNGLASL